MIVYIITRFCESNFSQSEVKLGGFFRPHPKTSSKKPNQNWVKASRVFEKHFYGKKKFYGKHKK